MPFLFLEAVNFLLIVFIPDRFLGTIVELVLAGTDFIGNMAGDVIYAPPHITVKGRACLLSLTTCKVVVNSSVKCLLPIISNSTLVPDSCDTAL